MRGGENCIEGDAGDWIGCEMHDGYIRLVVGGNAGDMLGFNMTNGTILVLGNAGRRAAAGMHGGTIGNLGPVRPPVLPTYRFEHTEPLTKLAERV